VTAATLTAPTTGYRIIADQAGGGFAWSCRDCGAGIDGYLHAGYADDRARRHRKRRHPAPPSAEAVLGVRERCTDCGGLLPDGDVHLGGVCGMCSVGTSATAPLAGAR
jgi:hypothetical protein